MISSSDSGERRKYPRKGITAEARVIPQGTDNGSEGRILNISPKGMYLETRASLTVGEMFRVEVTHSIELTEGTTFRGSVVWYHTLEEKNATLYGYGVQFV